MGRDRRPDAIGGERIVRKRIEHCGRHDLTHDVGVRVAVAAAAQLARQTDELAELLRLDGHPLERLLEQRLALLAARTMELELDRRTPPDGRVNGLKPVRAQDDKRTTALGGQFVEAANESIYTSP